MDKNAGFRLREGSKWLVESTLYTPVLSVPTLVLLVSPPLNKLKQGADVTLRYDAIILASDHATMEYSGGGKNEYDSTVAPSCIEILNVLAKRQKPIRFWPNWRFYELMQMHNSLVCMYDTVYLFIHKSSADSSCEVLHA